MWKWSFLKYVTGCDPPSSQTADGKKLVTAACFLIPITFLKLTHATIFINEHTRITKSQECIRIT
jgi:hypothetical protein